MLTKLIHRAIVVFTLITSVMAQGGGYALDFDGSNDYVNTTYSGISGNNDRTVEVWVKTSATGVNFITEWGVQETNQRFTVTVTSSKLRVEFAGSWLLGSTNVNDGLWHHLAATHSSTSSPSTKLYIDGNLEATASFTINTSSSGNVLVGKSAYWPEREFEGSIDEVRIWSVARTAAQIADNIHVELDGDETGLVAYFKMSNGQGTTITDHSENSNTGTMVNMANSDWITSYAPIGDLTSGYTTDVEALWKGCGTSASDASDGLTMVVGTALTDANFAVYGNNNTSGTSTSDISSVGSAVRTGRIWQVDESGTVAGTVTIDISDATGNAGQSGTASNFRLLYRSGTSGDFSSAATGASISGDVVTFTSVSLADGYYALGAESDASLPVELTSFEVLSTRDNSITLQWITESEINNLGFILDRRVPGTEWTEIATYITHPELQGQGSVTHQTIYSYTDNTVLSAETYDYRLADVDYDGNKVYHSMTVMGVSPNDVVPETFTLYPAYPNPFNPVTTIRFDIPEGAANLLSLRIFDINGGLVETLMDGQREPGIYTVQWDGSDQPSGVYFSRLESGSTVAARKLILLK